MKTWVWSVFVFLVTAFVIFYLNPPWLITMLIVIPVLIYMFIFGSFLYSFRESLKPESIPRKGYEKRIRETEEKARDLPRGFREIDRFYIKAVPDSTTFAYLHESEPVFFCLYHFDKKMGLDVVTLYDNGFGLTTNNSIDAGMAPRRAKDLIQIFPRTNYEKLYQKHMEGHIFLIERGLRPLYPHPSEFRHYFMKDYRSQGEYIKTFFLWPLVLLSRTVSQYGKKYCLSIREQFEKGMIKIFH